MSNSRQFNRAREREQVKFAHQAETGHGKKVGPGKQNDWLNKHPKLAPYYRIAVACMKTGERSHPPTWRATKKMVVVLATAPKINLPGFGRVPATLAVSRHVRGSWRSFKSVPINANLQVTA